MPVDRTDIINYVNSHPNSTWTARANDKFKGASKSEIRQTLGTVVDPNWTIKTHMKTH